MFIPSIKDYFFNQTPADFIIYLSSNNQVTFFSAVLGTTSKTWYLKMFFFDTNFFLIPIAL